MNIKFDNLNVKKLYDFLKSIDIKEKLYLEFSKNSIKSKIFPVDKSFIFRNELIFNGEDETIHTDEILKMPLYNLKDLISVINIYYSSKILNISGIFVVEENIVNSIKIKTKELSYEIKSTDISIIKNLNYLEDSVYNKFIGNDNNICYFLMENDILNRLNLLIKKIDEKILTPTICLNINELVSIKSNTPEKWEISLDNFEIIKPINKKLIFNKSLLNLDFNSNYDCNVKFIGDKYILTLKGVQNEMSLIVSMQENE
jgi:hypothetical protein